MGPPWVILPKKSCDHLLTDKLALFTNPFEEYRQIKSIQTKLYKMGDEAADATTVTLRVRDQAGDEMFFKVKKETKMQKIMDAYASRKGVNSAALRFSMDGNRIQDTDTPKMLELEDDDQIDVMLETIGGSGIDSC